MGLLPAARVDPFWYVQPGDGLDTDTAPPEPGVTFQGTRHDLVIDDVIDALGNRRPAAKDAPKEFRIGFVLLSRNGNSASAASVNQVEEFAREIEGLFRRETRQLGRLHAGL